MHPPYPPPSPVQSGKVGEYRIDGNLVETFHKLASLGHLALHVANFTVAHLASVCSSRA